MGERHVGGARVEQELHLYAVDGTGRHVVAIPIPAYHELRSAVGAYACHDLGAEARSEVRPQV